MNNNQRNRVVPKTQQEISAGKELSHNRSLDVKKEVGDVKDFTIALKDIDTAMVLYVRSILKPIVKENNELIKVPVKYANAERWKAMQADGYYRDKDGKVQVPLILFQRTSATKNRELTTKIDADFPQIYASSVRQYSAKDRYNQFDILNGIKPKQQVYYTIVPEYLDITYEITLWTNYVTSMDTLEELFWYAEGSYWGDKEKFVFKTKIDTIQSSIEMEVKSDRYVKSTLEMTLHGYIIPDTIQKELSKRLTKTTTQDIKTDNIL